jgi:hypothetical protein
MIVVLAISLGYSQFSLAQSDNTPSEINLFVGNMLPNEIQGVTDILPVFGGRYSFGTGFGGVELGGMNTHAFGTDFTTLEASLKGNMTLSQGLEGVFYGGGDFNYYSEKNQTNRQIAYGLHAGGGAMMLVSDTLWLRGELKFMAGPGTSLYLLFGLVFRSNGL